jgi:transcription factor TGA
MVTNMETSAYDLLGGGRETMNRENGVDKPPVLSLFVSIHAAAGYPAARPPTLEIFPSWPTRHQQQLHSVSD